MTWTPSPRPPATTSGCTSPGSRLPGRAGAGDRARRGLLRLGLRRQALPRRPRRPVRRAGRPRPHELAEAAAKQAAELAYFPLWSYAHPKAIELAERLADAHARRPEPDLLHHRRLRGRRVGVEAGPVYFKRTGKPNKHKVISRDIAYHGTSMGALSITGLPASRRTSSRWCRPRVRVPNTNLYRAPPARRPTAPTPRRSAAGPPTASRRRSSSRGRTRSRRSSWSRCRTPAAASRRRPATSSGSARSATRYDVLLVSDEVICAFGRLGEYFGADRYGYQPDIITFAKGLTSGYVPLGAMIATDRLVEPFLKDTNWFAHGVTFGGHPVASAVALANLDIFEREDLNGHVRDNEPLFRSYLERLLRPADRRRRPRRRLLLRHRAGQGQGDPGDVRRRRVGAAAARFPLEGALRRRPLLPGRRPG